MKKSRFKIAKAFLCFWTIFIGFGAVAGAVGMLVDPSGKILGMDGMLPYFQKLPFADTLFQDLTFSGCALLIVNGITNLTAAILLFKNKKCGIVLGGIFGITLMLWICIQFYMFPFNFMSTIYFIFGFCQALTAFIAYVFKKQETFSVDTSQYKNIKTNKNVLVVYFSRMGYVKHVAYETADMLGADIYEIKATEKTEGTLGFWWCGRYGMNRWEMPIEKIDIDLSSYDEVIVCAPIWVFSLAAPIRTFLKEANGKIKKISYILVHFTNGKYSKAVKTADALVGLQHNSSANVRCRASNFKKLD